MTAVRCKHEIVINVIRQFFRSCVNRVRFDQLWRCCQVTVRSLEIFLYCPNFAPGCQVYYNCNRFITFCIDVYILSYNQRYLLYAITKGLHSVILPFGSKLPVFEFKRTLKVV